MHLGQEIDLVTKVQLVGRSTTNRSYSVIAGSYLAVNAYAQSISPAMLQQAQTRLDGTRQILENADQTQLATLTRQELLGDMFHTGGLGYYAQLTSISHIMGLNSQARFGLVAGIGTIGYEPKVDTFFGIPRAISAGGISFDIPIYQTTASLDGDAQRDRLYTQQVGILSSALEHATPEQMFQSSDPNDPEPDAISAVKALQKASAAGQRIYEITRDNMATILPSIHHDADTISEIRAALNAGKLVITHIDAVTVPGWSGAGYIILDQETGAGAYKISGGGNGSFFEYALVVLLVLGALTGASELLILIGSLVSLVASIVSFLDNLQGCGLKSLAVLIIAMTLFALLFALAFSGVGWAIISAIGGTIISLGFPDLEASLCSI